MKARFAFFLLAVSMLCTCVLAQEKTTEDWLKEGRSLMLSGSMSFDPAANAFNESIQLEPKNIDAWLDFAQVLIYMGQKNESLEAFQKALSFANETLKQNPNDAAVWQSQGLALACLGRDDEATRSFEKSVEILNQSIDENPKDAEAWWLKADNLDILGQSQSALEAYDKVIELNSSKAIGAWIRKSDILLGQMGRYDESVRAFDKATDLMAVNSNATTLSHAFFSEENGSSTVLNTWTSRGRILRVSFGRYNYSAQDYDRFLKVDSDYIKTFASKRGTITPQGKLLGKYNNSLYSWEPNAEQYARPQPKWNTLGFQLKWGHALQYDEGATEVAAQVYDRAIQIDSNSSEAWTGKGVALLAQGKNGEALSVLDKALELDPENADAWSYKGNALSSMDRIDESVRAYERAIYLYDEKIKNNSLQAEAWDGKGIVLENLGLAKNDLSRYDEALKAYNKAIEIDPQDAEAWYDKGYALSTLARFRHEPEKYNESLQAFDEAIYLKPRFALAWVAKGSVFLDQQRYEDALQAYDKALYINSGLQSAQSGRGAALEKLGRRNESAKSYEITLMNLDMDIQAANSSQVLSEVWYKKGSILQAQGMYEEAQKALHNATNADPKNVMAWVTKGDVFRWQAKYDDSLQAYEKAIENLPSNSTWQLSDAWSSKGDVLEEAGRTDEAISAFDKAILIDSQNNYPWLAKGDIFNQTGKQEEAVKAYDKAIQIAQSSPSFLAKQVLAKAWYNKGQALKALDRKSEADAAFAKAKELEYRK